MQNPSTTLADYLWRVTPMEKFHCEVILTNHCNLNCKGCDHFAPFAKPQFYDLYQYKEDIQHIRNLWNDDVSEIFLQGGEPLLHPNIIDFMEVTRKTFPEVFLRIITNGLLLKDQKDLFWEALKYYNVELAVSRYFDLDFEPIEENVNKYGITYFVFGEKSTEMRRDILDLTGSQDPRHSFMNCFMSNSCIPITNGYTYVCPTAATILNYAKKFNLNITEKDCGGKRILDFKTKEEMAEFYLKEIPLCRFCEKTIWDLPWEKSQGKVTDYLE